MSFLGLLSVTVLYAALAADQSEKRAASEGALAAMTIFSAIALGLHGLLLFLEASAPLRSARIFRMYVGLILPFVSLVFLYLATTEVERLAGEESYSIARAIGIGSPALFLVLGPLIWWLKPFKDFFASLEKTFPYGGILIITVVGLVFSFVWAGPPETLLSNAMITAIELGAFVQMTLFTSILAAGPTDTTEESRIPRPS
jgi:hypothetical protein